jgi:hypothetical protein
VNEFWIETFGAKHEGEKKTSGEKGVGGHWRLSGSKKNNFQYRYGKAIRSNTSDLQEVRRADKTVTSRRQIKTRNTVFVTMTLF